MNALIYFSATGETKKVHDYFKHHLPNLSEFNITDINNRLNFDFKVKYNLVILSLPVYSENIPIPVREFLIKLKCKYIIINLTYGSVTPGNALKRVCRLLSPNTNIIGASLIPLKHTYYDNSVIYVLSKLDSLINKCKSDDYSSIKIPKIKGHLLAPLLENIRTRYNIKIKHDASKCINCHTCIKECPVKAINSNHIINKSCLRCLRCVNVCPNNALTYKRSKLLELYLNKNIKPQSILVFK